MIIHNQVTGDNIELLIVLQRAIVKSQAWVLDCLQRQPSHNPKAGAPIALQSEEIATQGATISHLLLRQG